MRISRERRNSRTRFGQVAPLTGRRRWRLLLVPLLGVAVICQLGLAGNAVIARASTTAKTALAAGTVAPNATNELDCNGWSPKYGTVRKLAGDLCTDPIKVVNGKAQRFIDNGWYQGHDEPSVKFISSTPGSGNTMTYLTKVAVDPRKAPTASGSVTNYGQLSIAPWFGLPMCDPKSYPQNPCTPDSDTNSGLISDPNAAGSAFMELQLYPPGYTPFVDSESCSKTKWCAALTIDSLECNFNFATCNPNCEEPVNFAYLQTNGVPAGPPSPQLTDVSTFTPNRNTLMINGGDTLVVSISDPPQGFTTVIRDLTTHQTGFMVASAGNGFMNTSIADCSGTPYTFHAEYSTAKQQNQVPWAAAEGGVLMEQEIGHSEVCNSVANKDPFTASYPGGQSYSDPNTYDTCVGGLRPERCRRGPHLDRRCQNATTQGPNGPERPTEKPGQRRAMRVRRWLLLPEGSANRPGSTAWRPLRGRMPTSASLTATRTATWTSTACPTSRIRGRTAPGTIRPRSSTPGRSRPTGDRIRRSSSSPTSAARPPCATPRPARTARFRRSARRSTRTGRSARCSPRWGPRTPRACGTSVRTCRTPSTTSARTRSTARLTWPATAARSSVRSSPIPSSPAAARSSC